MRNDRAISGNLLWPPHYTEYAQDSSPPLDPQVVADLGLDNTVLAFGAGQKHRQDRERILFNLCQDPDVIRYRQDVIEDLLDHLHLFQCFDDLLPKIDELVVYRHVRRSEEQTLYEVTSHLGELELFTDCITEMLNAFKETEGKLRSRALLALRDTATRIEGDETFQNLVRELPDLLSRLRTSASVTIGVNLDHRLRPVQATLLSVNKERFTSPSLMNRILGKRISEWEGMAPLHTVPRRESGGMPGVPSFPASSETHGWAVNPLMVPLFRDLALVLEKVAQPIAKALDQYTKVHTGFLAELRQELAFYLGAVRLIRRIQDCGLPMCRPQLAAREERICEVEESFNINLALHLSIGRQQTDLRQVIVRNDINIGRQGRILILTGPNQGGKTTYLQSVGLNQVLAQAGLFVPGRKARISPVDSIYTHFPTEEKLERGIGRFGDEAQRLRQLFRHVTRDSLVLLNESLSSTNVGESIYLAQDIVRVLRLLGARAIYTTHMHELAASVDALNAETTGDSQIVSMVSSPISEERARQEDGEADFKRTYKVVPGPPMGRSYARELAVRYGIDYEQLIASLQRRGELESDGTGET